MANEKILVVDDDTNICELLRLYLTKEGYQVTTANDGEEGLDKFNLVKPDMVLLDVMMPKMDGLEVCRRIRKLGNTPVMMLTAKGETFDKVLGLELGADDYISKPFRLRELMARIKTVLRRSKGAATEEIRINGLTVRMKEGKVLKNGQEVILTALEYKLLLTFLQNRGRVLSRNMLLESIWDVAGDFVSDNTLSVYIKRLREKIEDDPVEPQIIKTVRGMGYKVDE